MAAATGSDSAPWRASRKSVSPACAAARPPVKGGAAVLAADTAADQGRWPKAPTFEVTPRPAR